MHELKNIKIGLLNKNTKSHTNYFSTYMVIFMLKMLTKIYIDYMLQYHPYVLKLDQANENELTFPYTIFIYTIEVSY